MPDKITLASIASFQNDTTAAVAYNSNNALITTALDNTLSRDGTSPNQMLNNLDMNNNQILNLPAPATVNSPARLVDVASNPTISVPNLIGNISTSITSAGSQLAVQNSSTTKAGIYNPLVPGGYFNYDGISSTVIAPSGSTVQGVSGLSFYVQNSMVSFASGAKGNAVGVFGIVSANADGSSSWGINPALNDTVNNASTATSSRKLIGAEFDFTVASNNSGTSVQGVSVILNGLFGNVSAGNGFQVSQTSGSLAKWVNSFVSDSGAASVALIVGSTSASGTSINSQPIVFQRFDSGSVGHNDSLYSRSDGALIWPGSISSGISVAALSSYILNGITIITLPAPFTQLNGADGTGRVFLGNSVNSTALRNSNGTFFQNDLGTTTYASITSTGISFLPAVAVPAGGTTGTGLTFSTTANLGVFFGSNVPTLSAAQGSLYIRTDGSSVSTRLYINTNGSTTWTNVTTAA